MLVVGPNLALDRLVRIPELRPGEVQHFQSADVRPGGKGVNVCRAAARLGARARLVAFVPGRTGAAAAQMLFEEGGDLLAVPCQGEIRAATIVLEAGGRVTVLNEPGPAIDAESWRACEELVAEELGAGEWLVCIGSSPPGTPSDGYARLSALAPGRCLVDANGDLLRRALAARPAVACPNEAEVAGSFGIERDPASQARLLVEKGAAAAVVKAGERGCAWFDGYRGGTAVVGDVRVVNPIGAGDAFVAGLVSVLEAGGGLGAAVEQASAVAAASVEELLPGTFDPLRAQQLSAKVRVS